MTEKKDDAETCTRCGGSGWEIIVEDHCDYARVDCVKCSKTNESKGSN